MNFKKFYSKYYNFVYKSKNYKLEVDYILRLLKSKKKKIKTILELGSGTGAHAKYLIRKGFKLTCVEKSSKMILNFKSNLKKIKIINADLRKLKLKNKFDLVLSMFHVINYMVKNKDINAFFNTASRHLNSGGILVFDTWYYPAVKYNPPKKTKKIFIYKKFKIIKVAIPNKLNKKIFNIKYLFNIINSNNSSNFNFIENHIIRAFNIKELDKISKKYNFKKIANYSFLKRTKPSPKNFGAILIYQKL
jgi:SAM-dependent methyltransferase